MNIYTHVKLDRAVFVLSICFMIAGLQHIKLQLSQLDEAQTRLQISAKDSKTVTNIYISEHLFNLRIRQLLALVYKTNSRLSSLWMFGVYHDFLFSNIGCFWTWFAVYEYWVFMIIVFLWILSVHEYWVFKNMICCLWTKYWSQAATWIFHSPAASRLAKNKIWPLQRPCTFLDLQPRII